MGIKSILIKFILAVFLIIIIALILLLLYLALPAILIYFIYRRYIKTNKNKYQKENRVQIFKKLEYAYKEGRQRKDNKEF